MAKNHLIAGLDIGSGTIKILVTAKPKEGSEPEVLALAEEASFGLRRGVVIDPDKVSSIIQSLLKKVQDQSGERINSVYTSIGGAHISCIPSQGVVSVSRADQKISEEDITRVLNAAEVFPLPSNKEILDVFPKEFIVDGERGIKEPLGMQGVRLEAEVLAITTFSPYLKNLTKAVLNSGLQILDIIPTPLASARAVLTPREKELGVALLDIGAGTTGLVIFEENSLVHLSIFPIGSGHITNDIAIGLKTDIDTAERIKVEFGSSFLPKTSKKEKIEKEDGELLVFSPKFLIKIIQSRLSEIFNLVNKELKKLPCRGLLPAGIVLTGGGAKLPKIKEFCREELKLPCRIGKPGKSPPFYDDPRLVSVLGLVMFGIESERESPTFNFGKGIGSKIKKIFKIFIP